MPNIMDILLPPPVGPAASGQGDLGDLLKLLSVLGGGGAGAPPLVPPPPQAPAPLGGGLPVGEFIAPKEEKKEKEKEKSPYHKVVEAVAQAILASLGSEDASRKIVESGQPAPPTAAPGAAAARMASGAINTALPPPPPPLGGLRLI